MEDHRIDVGFVMGELDRNWTEFPRNFIKEVMRSAEWQLILKGERSFSASNVDFAKTKYFEEWRYYDAIAEHPDHSPIPLYFIYLEQKDDHYTSLIQYVTTCKLARVDADFDLFFALQFLFIDLMIAREFLEFHLKETFRNDPQEFEYFLDDLCLKYDAFLPENRQKFISKYLKKLSEKSGFRAETEAEKTTEMPQNKPKHVETRVAEDFGQSISVTENLDEIEPNIPVLTNALKHVYLALAHGQGVTQQNKHLLAKKYGYKNGVKLRNLFTLYEDREKRMNLNRENKNAAKATLQRYRVILPILQTENKDAYDIAVKEFQLLEREYDAFIVK